MKPRTPARSAAVVVIALPVLDVLAKALLGGMGWAFVGLFVFLGPVWLVWYLVLVVVAVLLWRQGGVFQPGRSAGRWLALGSVAAQLALFTLICWLTPDASDQEEWPSALGRVLGMGYAEDRRAFGRVLPVHAAQWWVGAVFCAFLLMLVVLLSAWLRSRSERRGPAR
ncbi:MAG: hypothetical protein ACRC20_11410 [Segniliparus sp.]|uniref:hypothetical protein n=1 Tax=Segniliparus sp. TaxID=2804064 RepID=UPI003F2C6FE8